MNVAEHPPRSNDWLTLLLYAMDLLLNPAPHKILQTFEEWDYTNRLGPQLRSLQRTGVLQRRGRGRQVRLEFSPQGRLAAHGGIDALDRWQRPWDGTWRLLLFDLPVRNSQLRQRLWRWLRTQRLGYLQNSVWISPDPVDESTLPLRHLKLNPESFIVLESRPVAPHSNGELVKSAWDFEMIGRHHQAVLDLAARGTELMAEARPGSAQLQHWLAAERRAWQKVLAVDPLLPERLLPAGYRGRAAWEARQGVFSALARKLVGSGKNPVTPVT